MGQLNLYLIPNCLIKHEVKEYRIHDEYILNLRDFEGIILFIIYMSHGKVGPHGKQGNTLQFYTQHYY